VHMCVCVWVSETTASQWLGEKLQVFHMVTHHFLSLFLLTMRLYLENEVVMWLWIPFSFCGIICINSYQLEVYPRHCVNWHAYGYCILRLIQLNSDLATWQPSLNMTMSAQICKWWSNKSTYLVFSFPHFPRLR